MSIIQVDRPVTHQIANDCIDSVILTIRHPWCVIVGRYRYLLRMMARMLPIFSFLFFTACNLLAQTIGETASKTFESFRSNEKEVLFPFESPERFNWHYVPRSRKGIAFANMNDDQQKLVMDLLAVSLSDQGFNKAKGVLELEDILRKVEGRPADDDYRDRLNYSFTLFGKPEDARPWGWRLEGHHLSLNFTLVNGKLESATPSFFGANPATVPSGSQRGHQTLRDESELAFALLHSLNEEQKKAAVISTRAPFDILSRNDRKATLPSETGISFTALSETQQKSFLRLLDVYVKNYEFGFASKLMEKIRKAGVEKLSFAWAGSEKPGAPHYYRIQGPMLLIEFDNTQNNGNHIHSVVRDLTNDFAEDILREHLQKEHGRQ